MHISPSRIIPVPRHLCINADGAQLFALLSAATEYSIRTSLASAQLCLFLAEPQRESKDALSYCCLQ